MQFYYIYRYLYNENIDLPSVMTALTTLYAAHKYMCPGLAKEVIILQIPFKTSICNRTSRLSFGGFYYLIHLTLFQVVSYLKNNLKENNVLLVLQHICLYCSSATVLTKL